MRVLINGFGRIGRSVLRAWAQEPQAWPDVQIVAINDITTADMCAYLFEFDSIFGPWKGSVTLDGATLRVNDHALRLTQSPDLSVLDLSGIDLVMECTGRADSADIARRGLRAGAKKVLISGPSAAADFTVVLGANDAGLPVNQARRFLGSLESTPSPY